MHQGEYDPSHQSPYRTHAPAPSPQYVGNQYPAYGNPPAPQGYAAAGYPHPQFWPPGQQPALRASGMGLASLVLSVVSGVAVIALVIAAGVMANRHGGTLDEKSVEAVTVGLGIMVGIVLNIVGLVLGIVAMLQRDRKKAIAIVGLTLNGVLLLLVVGLIIVGIANS
jgi:hypothetical protein